MSRPNSRPKKRSQVNCAGKILCFNFHKINKNTFADFSKSKNIKKTQRVLFWDTIKGLSKNSPFK